MLQEESVGEVHASSSCGSSAPFQTLPCSRTGHMEVPQAQLPLQQCGSLLEGFASWSDIPVSAWHFCEGLRDLPSWFWSFSSFPYSWCPRRRRSWNQWSGRSWRPHPGLPVLGRSPCTWRPGGNLLHPPQTFWLYFWIKKIKELQMNMLPPLSLQVQKLVMTDENSIIVNSS